MADLIPKLTEDVAFIQQLGNNPNFDNNLTAEQLKAWFDKAPEAIKKYINATLVPELDKIITDMQERVDGMNAQVDNFVVGTGFLPTVGGTMTGAINMSSKRISGLPAPEADMDAARKKYVDDTVSSAKNELQTAVEKAETASKEAINATLDASALARGKASFQEETVTLTAADWSNNVQTVSVAGVNGDLSVMVGPHPTYHADYLEAGIYCSGQGDGVLVFTCTKAPKKAITVNVGILTAGDQTDDALLETELLGGAS